MFKSKGLNKKIKKIHEKSLRLVLNDHHSALDEMLDTLNEKTIHQQRINRLLTEVYKFLNGYSPAIYISLVHKSIVFRRILLAFFFLVHGAIVYFRH